MGHDSPRAALINLHSSDRRRRTLADAVAKATRAEFAKSERGKGASHLAREWHAVRMARQKPRTGERNRIADLRKYWEPRYGIEP